MASVSMTVQGKSRDTTTAIANSSAELGVSSSKSWAKTHTPTFIDFPFTEPNATFGEHLQVVGNVRPKIAVAPDVEHGRKLQDVIRQADELLKYADSVVIVPKSVHPREIPDRFRVGIPLANFGSGAPWGIWEYRTAKEVHLLGGGPARQLTAKNHLDNIKSVDTATLGKVSRYGMWDGKSIDAPDEWNYKQRLRISLDNYANAWG